MTIEHAEDIPDLESLSTQTNKLNTNLQRYSADRKTLERKYPVPLSEMCRCRFRRFISGWLVAIERLDFDAMNRAERIDYILFQNHLNFCLRSLDWQETEFQEMAPLIPFAKCILNLEEARRRMEWAEPEAAADRLNWIRIAIEAAQRSLEEDYRCDKCEPKHAWGDLQPIALPRLSTAFKVC